MNRIQEYEVNSGITLDAAPSGWRVELTHALILLSTGLHVIFTGTELSTGSLNFGRTTVFTLRGSLYSRFAQIQQFC